MIASHIFLAFAVLLLALAMLCYIDSSIYLILRHLKDEVEDKRHYYKLSLQMESVAVKSFAGCLIMLAISIIVYHI